VTCQLRDRPPPLIGGYTVYTCISRTRRLHTHPLSPEVKVQSLARAPQDCGCCHVFISKNAKEHTVCVLASPSIKMRKRSFTASKYVCRVFGGISQSGGRRSRYQALWGGCLAAGGEHRSGGFGCGPPCMCCCRRRRDPICVRFQFQLG
jgi:hypothetical protein